MHKSRHAWYRIVAPRQRSWESATHDGINRHGQGEQEGRWPQAVLGKAPPGLFDLVLGPTDRLTSRNGEGLVTQRRDFIGMLPETINVVDAWFGGLVGHPDANVRQ